MNRISDLAMFKGIRNPAWVNNPSRWWKGAGDFIQIALNETVYAVTVPDIRTVQKIEGAAHVAKRNGCGCWCITVVAHSQGTMVVKRALDLIDPKVKKHISLIGLGGETTFGPGDGVKFTMNVMHEADPVPNGWNRLSFWNGNDKGEDIVRRFGYKNAADAPAGALDYELLQGTDSHSWENSYLPYLRSHGFGIPRCSAVE